MKFTIQGRLDGLNSYTNTCRGNRYAGAEMKKRNQKQVVEGLLKCHSKAELKKEYKYPIKVNIVWYEPNKRRDVDNIQFATKFILDALVAVGVLEDDSQKYVNKIEHTVLVDKKNPRIEVELEE